MLRSKLNQFIGILFLGLITTQASADIINIKSLSKKLDPAKQQLILNHNSSVTQSGQWLNSTSTPGLTVKRPVAEYEDAGYLLFYSETHFNSADVKAKLIQNLPSGVTAVIYTDSDNRKDQEALYRYYSEMAPNKDQVKVINIPNPSKIITYKDESGDEQEEEVQPDGFWSRDTIPVPVIQTSNVSPIRALTEKFTVVDAKYYQEYEPDQYISDYFNASLLSHKYYYEGGNFMANANGDCIMIDTEAAQLIPTQVLTRSYGCKNLMRMPYLKGIGHADESFKFISDNHVLTDDTRYKRMLEAKGFKVSLLPRPKRDYETYVNSLIINGTVWVPVYQQATDQTALDVYRNLGLKVIAADSTILSNEGAGSIHCITMTYPKTTNFNDLLANFGATDVVDSASIDSYVEKKVLVFKQELKDQIEILKDPGLDRYLDTLYEEEKELKN